MVEEWHASLRSDQLLLHRDPRTLSLGDVRLNELARSLSLLSDLQPAQGREGQGDEHVPGGDLLSVRHGRLPCLVMFALHGFIACRLAIESSHPPTILVLGSLMPRIGSHARLLSPLSSRTRSWPAPLPMRSRCCPRRDNQATCTRTRAPIRCATATPLPPPPLQARPWLSVCGSTLGCILIIIVRSRCVFKVACLLSCRRLGPSHTTVACIVSSPHNPLYSNVGLGLAHRHHY